MLISLEKVIEDLNKIINDYKYCYLYYSANRDYITKCNPYEEQELGREQILDEIRALIRLYAEMNK